MRMIYLAIVAIVCSMNVLAGNTMKGDDAVMGNKTADSSKVVIMEENGPKAPDNVKAVDLGLPSGLKWANMNVGASSATDYGTYFAWGEVEPQTDNTYDWSSYKWSKGGNWDHANLTKYCKPYKHGYNGFYDHKLCLDSADDAAAVNWGGGWRMPTLNEYKELYDNCYWVWTSSYNGSGVAGYIVYKAKNSDKGRHVSSKYTPSASYSMSDNHIFLPCAGYRWKGSLHDAGSSGWYWSSSLYERDCSFASIFLFNSNDAVYNVSGSGRSGGNPVRAVCQ